MIKIDLSSEQKNEIIELMSTDIHKKLFPALIEFSQTILKAENFNNIAELINTEEKVKKICLLDSKHKLISCINQFESAISKDSISTGKSKIDITNILYNAYKDIYENFSGRNVAYKILKVMNVNVCPYCNRLYTFTIEQKTRPEFDHYFPKKKYPYLAVSIYNLVPSCGLCNKGKSEKEPDFILYPFEESFEDKGIHFDVQNTVPCLLGDKDSIIVKLEPYYDNIKIIDTYKDKFKIEDIYNQHSDYIIELLTKRQIFNKDMIDSLYCSYSEFFNSPDAVKQLVLGSYESDKYGQRPLSKLTRDILKQLN